MSTIGELLTVARRARGMTQAELGEQVGVSQVTINRYESGDREPNEAMVRRLAAVLGVTERFLLHGERYRGALLVDAHMRRQKSTKASLWRMAEAKLNLLRAHASLLFEEVALVAEQRVPTFDPEFTGPDEAARLVRAQWHLPIGPVRNLVRWMEAAGCLVFDEDLGTPRIDGLSQWVGDYPVVLVNAQAAPDRRRLTLAHELGHLVLHANDIPDDAERQANEFAAEFLMPEAVIRPQLRRLDYGRLFDLKREWGVSIQAIFERAHQLGLVTADERRAFYRGLNARGWKTKEPRAADVPLEQPELPASIGAALRAKGFSVEEIDALAGYAAGTANPFRPPNRRLSVV
jgi:Zn-dependent peptidase ImmA (M78 family)/transcriptional regulator with XRE-family HTH domain